MPAEAEVKKYASAHHIDYHSLDDLYAHPKIHELFEQRIGAMQHEFANYEQIKRFTLLPEAFTIQGGELTNTLKMRRAFIAEKYKNIINKMYE